MRRVLVKAASEHLHLLREVAPEVRSVDDNVVNLTRRAETHSRPVHVLAARALRLPSIAHILPPARQQEVILCAKVLVRAGRRHAAHDRRAELKDGRCILREDRHGVAVESEARNAAVRVHQQADMGVRLVGNLVEQPAVPLARPALLLAQDRFPPAEPVLLDLVVRVGECAFDSDFGRVVAVEECRVDFYACNLAACCAQADDDPVCGLSVVAPCLPAIVPGAGVHEDAGPRDGCGFCGEVLGGGEPFVAKGDNLGAEGCRNQI